VSLTDDAGAVEAAVPDPFAASHRPRNRPQTKNDALPHRRRALVARSYLARHHHLWDGSRRPRSGGRGRLLHQQDGRGLVVLAVIAGPVATTVTGPRSAASTNGALQ
jgi:hypothetical protein